MNENSRCEFEWSLVNTFRKPMLRQLTEAVYIYNTKATESLNLKNEYFKNNIEGIQLSKDQIYTCNKCGRNFETRSNLTEHFKDIHERLECVSGNCDYKSFGSKDHKNHMKLVHKIHS